MPSRWTARIRPPRSLRGQFSLALLALSLLVLTGGLTAVQALRNFSETSGRLAEERLERLLDAQHLVQNTLLIERESYRMLTDDSLSGMQGSYAEILRQMTSLASLVSSLGKTDTDATVLALHQSAQLFRKTAHIVVRLRQDILENGLTETSAANLRYFQGQLEIQVMAMASSASEVSVHLTDEYREKISRLAAVSKRDQRVVLTLIVGSLILAWLVSRFFLGRHVVVRLQQVSRYLRSAETFTEQIKVPVKGHDEIGNMARAVEQFLEDRRQLAVTQLSLQQSEEMLRAITDAVQSVVFLIDDEDRIQFVNPAVESTFGFSQEELIGAKMHELMVPKRFLRQVQEGLAVYRLTGEGPVVSKAQELIARHKDGRELNTLIHVGRIFKNGRYRTAGSRNCPRDQHSHSICQRQSQLYPGGHTFALSATGNGTNINRKSNES